jgi:Phage P22-like portal protein
MPSVPFEVSEPAVTDDEVWKECSERLRRAVEAEGENRSQGVKALEFRDGHQWPDDLYNQRKIDKRPSLTINHTNTFCRRVVNNMRQQRPRIKVHPVGEGADIEVAKVIEGIIRHIENISSASVAYDTGGESAVNIGWGYARILTEYIDEKSREQEIKIAPVRNTFTGYIDPSAQLPDGSDMEWFIFTQKMKRAEYNRLYPKADNREFQHTGLGDDMTDWETKDEIRLAEYFRIAKTTATLHYMSNGMNLWADEITKLGAELAAAKVTEIGNRKSYKREIQWFRVNGSKVVEKRTLPGRWIPVVRFEGNVLDLNGRIQRKGMVADLMDPARMFNYWRTKQTEVLALTPISSYVGAAGSFTGHGEWATANQKPHAYLEYEVVTIEQPDGSKTPIPPPQRSPPIQVPAGFSEAAQSAQQDLMAVAGMPHEPGADTPGAVVSGVALRKRQALSDIGHFQYYDNQTQAIAQIGRICLDYIPVYLSTERMQRILGDDGVPSMVKINEKTAESKVKNDLTVGRYDVVMDTGPGYQTKREEAAETMVDLLKITPLAEIVAKVGADLAIRAIDAPYMDELADRIMGQTPEGLKKMMETLPDSAKNIVKTFVAQLNAANQKITQLEADLKYSLTKTHTEMATKLAVEHLHDKRAEKDTDTDNATKRFDTHVRSDTALKVEAMRGHVKLADTEINAGAQLLNTHAEAAHETVARRETLEAAEKAEKANGKAE